MQISAFLLCHGGIFQQKPGVEEGGGLYKKSGIAPYFLELLVSLSNLNIAVAVYILGGWQKIQSILGDTFMGTSLLCISYAKIVL